MTTKHTPTPWSIHWLMGTGNYHWISRSSNEEDRVCLVETFAPTDGDMEAVGKANAAFIVRACNSHDELVAALELALSHMPDNERLYYGKDNGDLDTVKQALAKAKGEA